MKVRLEHPFLLFVISAYAAVSYSAHAADPNAYLYIAHAASGRSISSATNPEYAVDISLGGHCVAQGVSFGEIRGPFVQPAGALPVKVSISNSANPCGGSVVFSPTISLSAGSTALGILTVTSAHAIGGQIAAVNLSAVLVGRGRLIVANVSPDNLTGALSPGDSTSSPITQNFAAGTVSEALPGAGEYTVTVFPEGSSTAATGPLEFDVVSRNVYLVVLTGSTTNNSVQVIGPRVIRDVF